MNNLQQDNIDIYTCWIITEIQILISSAVFLSLAIMPSIKFKSSPCYNTELPEESSIFGVVKIITVPTFKTTITDYYQGTSQMSHCRKP
jgi:hypothetical protein